MGELRRYKFLDVFTELADGSLLSKIPLEINGINFPPNSVFQKGVVYGGIDFNLFKYRDIAIEIIENDEGPKRVAGFYQN